MAKMTKNVSVNYNEGLYYVDYTNIYMYHLKTDPSVLVCEKDIPTGKEDLYEFDPEMTQAKYESIRMKLTDSLCQKFPSLQASAPDEYADKRKTKRIIASNQLFHFLLEDNSWSLAIELLQNPKANEGLQTQMFPSFLEGLRTSLFEQFDTLHVRTGTWTSQAIQKTDPKDIGNVYVPTSVAEAILYDED